MSCARAAAGCGTKGADRSRWRVPLAKAGKHRHRRVRLLARPACAYPSQSCDSSSCWLARLKHQDSCSDGAGKGWSGPS